MHITGTCYLCENEVIVILIKSITLIYMENVLIIVNKIRNNQIY